MAVEMLAFQVIIIIITLLLTFLVYKGHINTEYIL